MSQTMTAVFLAGQDCARAATSYFPSFSDRERKVNENSASSAQATEAENAIAPAQVSAVNSRMGHLGGRRPVAGPAAPLWRTNAFAARNNWHPAMPRASSSKVGGSFVQLVGCCFPT